MLDPSPPVPLPLPSHYPICNIILLCCSTFCDILDRSLDDLFPIGKPWQSAHRRCRRYFRRQKSAKIGGTYNVKIGITNRQTDRQTDWKIYTRIMFFNGYGRENNLVGTFDYFEQFKSLKLWLYINLKCHEPSRTNTLLVVSHIILLYIGGVFGHGVCWEHIPQTWQKEDGHFGFLSY